MWVLVIFLFVFLGTIYLVWWYAKQVRALRFCFLNFSDWVSQQIIEEREIAVAKYGEEGVTTEKRYLRDWNNQLNHYEEVMKRAGLERLNISDKLYGLED
jgi:hypothetical protein